MGLEREGIEGERMGKTGRGREGDRERERQWRGESEERGRKDGRGRESENGNWGTLYPVSLSFD